MLLLGALMTMLGPWAAAAPSTSGRALLIGASSSKMGPDLPAAEADVDLMADLLQKEFDLRPDRIEILKGKDATVEAVVSGLKSLANKVSDKETAIVYFAGAGALVGDLNLDEPDPWDEALTLRDGLLVDDELDGLLANIDAKAGHVAFVVDASREPNPGEERPDVKIRFAGSVPKGKADAASGEGGDGLDGWPHPGSVVLLEAAHHGAAAEGELNGWFSEALSFSTPRVPTYRDLERQLVAAVASMSLQVPDITGDLDLPVFNIERDVKPLEVTKFEVPPQKTLIRLSVGNQANQVRSEQAEEMQALLKRNAEYGKWLQFDDDRGAFVVQRDPFSNRDEIRLQIVGPEGAIRNTITERPPLSVAEQVMDKLYYHSRQRAILGMAFPSGPLRVRMVEAPTQDECHSTWVEAPPGDEQIVPMCHRWQLEVTLGKEAKSAMEVGGLILANDGNLLGFPLDGNAVTLAPGRSRLFELDLARGNGPKGIRSTPPLGIPEYVLAFAGPAGSGVDFSALSSIGGGGKRGIGQGGTATGPWIRTQLAYRVEANAETDPQEPVATREFTLNDFDVSYLKPANTNSYLYKVLENMERLVDFKAGDGLDYAQCLPKTSSRVNNRTRFSTERWPRGECWDRPWDFAQDEGELLNSPGIDCSTTVWWVYTRACKGNMNEPVLEPRRRESYGSSSYVSRVRKWHTKQRECLLLSESDYKGGYLNTAFMLKKEYMNDHWLRCDDEEMRTGDVLVTKTRRGGGGHTYIVVDPKRFVVFGSHVSDLDPSVLTEEELAMWEEYERAQGEKLDAGVEYQFLVWRGKESLSGGKWQGFGNEVLQACLRHREIAKEWDKDRSSRPGTGQLKGICNTNWCELP